MQTDFLSPAPASAGSAPPRCPLPGSGCSFPECAGGAGAKWRSLEVCGTFSSISPSTACCCCCCCSCCLLSAPLHRPYTPPNMRFAGLGSAVLLASLLALVGVCSGRSDAPRGVAVGFVFDPKARCDPPCEHAGICIRNNTCFCSRGYEGETCQYANCYPKCKNGGECLRPGKCRCPPGFGGRYCHKVTCDAGCWNGGECIAVNGVAKCICPSSWTGSKCQEAICPQGCRNGGICVAPGICSCPEGWLGGACHTAVCAQPCLNGGKCISPDKCRCRPLFSGPRCGERKKSH